MRGFGGSITSSILPAAIGATGAIGLDILWGYGSQYLPAQLQSGWLALGAKVVGAFGAAALASKVVSRDKVKVALAGALTVIAYQELKNVLHQAAPSIPGLGAYMNPLSGFRGLGAANPASFVRNAPALGRMSAYMRPSPMGSMSGAMNEDMFG